MRNSGQQVLFFDLYPYIMDTKMIISRDFPLESLGGSVLNGHGIDGNSDEVEDMKDDFSWCITTLKEEWTYMIHALLHWSSAPGFRDGQFPYDARAPLIISSYSWSHTSHKQGENRRLKARVSTEALISCLHVLSLLRTMYSKNTVDIPNLSLVLLRS